MCSYTKVNILPLIICFLLTSAVVGGRSITKNTKFKTIERADISIMLGRAAAQLILDFLVPETSAIQIITPKIKPNRNNCITNRQNDVINTIMNITNGNMTYFFASFDHQYDQNRKSHNIIIFDSYETFT